MLDLHVDRKDPLPPYRQIADALIARVRAGEYQPRDRLPSAQDIVQAAGVAELTARKALRAMLEQGWASLSPGMGYYVPDRLPAE